MFGLKFARTKPSEAAPRNEPALLCPTCLYVVPASGEAVSCGVCGWHGQRIDCVPAETT